MAQDNARSTGPALERMQAFLRWLASTVERFPRSQKFTLGDRLLDAALDVLERIVEATYTRARSKSLHAANLGVEKLRILLRLAADLRALDLRRWEFAARSLDEIGKLIGGWIRAERSRGGTADAAAG